MQNQPAMVLESIDLTLSDGEDDAETAEAIDAGIPLARAAQPIDLTVSNQAGDTPATDLIDTGVPLAGSFASASASSSSAETGDSILWEVPQDFDKTLIKKLVDNHNMSADACDEVDTPLELNVELLPHQKRAVKWMLHRETKPLMPVGQEIDFVTRRGVAERPVSAKEEDRGADEQEPCLGGLLCDEQGLGKTLTVIALMLSNPPLDENGRPRKWHSIIVCPVSLVGQWKEEIETRITRPYRPSVHIYHGPKRIRNPVLLSEFDIIITTYTTLSREYPKLLRKDPKFDEMRKAKLPLPRREPGPLFQCEWHRIVLDEAHTIKNMKTEGFTAACSVPAKIRWCLTGTPIQNSVDDIYSLFVFLRYQFMPRMSTANWKANWKSKIESPYTQTRAKAFQRFQPVVAAVTLRRTKLDTIEGKTLISLPPRRMEVVETDFKLVDEALKYNELQTNSHSELQRLRSMAGGLGKNYTGVLLLLLRLRQACCHPMLSEYAAKKTRGSSGAKDLRFTSQYTVSQLDEAQVLVDSGISNYMRLDTKVQDSLSRVLAPPEQDDATPGPELHLVSCCKCGLAKECQSAQIHCAVGVFCHDCAAEVRNDPASKMSVENDPFVPFEDTRREVHARARSARLQTEQVEKAKRDPRLLKPSTKTSIILEKVLAMRDRGEGEKCLIFSQWTSFLDIISMQLESLGFQCCRLDGSMSLKKRKEEVARFRTDDSVTVFLLSMHAAGTGLNLTEANNVILADSWWNPSVEVQCCDRVHRIGQTRPVQITRLKIKDTCEERIFELCARKAETCASALGDSGGKSSGRQKLSLEDAIALFGDENNDVRIPDRPTIVADDALDSLESALSGMQLA